MNKWSGSEDKISGIATFTINGKESQFNLQSFQDFLQIANLIDVSFQMGRNSAKFELIAGIENAVGQFNRDFK